MIKENVVVKFKSASQKKKQLIKQILMDNYESLIDQMVKSADYGCTTSYWINHIPIGNKILTADEFIAKYGKKLKRKSKTKSNITARQIGGLLFGIHEHTTHPDKSEHVVYYEEDVIRLLVKLGFPKPIWGEHIDIKKFKF